jgi:MFS family permease
LTNINYFWTFGSILVAGMAWVMLDLLGWQVLAALTAVPVGISLLWAIWAMPESPRWLVLKGRSEEAAEILRAAAATNGVRLAPFKLRPPAASVVEKEEAAITLADFLGADIRMVTIPLFTVWFLSGVTYYGT